MSQSHVKGNKRGGVCFLRMLLVFVRFFLFFSNYSFICLTQTFEALPGFGWDNLRNIHQGQVFNFSYFECHLTEDGSYLLPDHVVTVPLKTNHLESTSTFVGRYQVRKGQQTI